MPSPIKNPSPMTYQVKSLVPIHDGNEHDPNVYTSVSGPVYDLTKEEDILNDDYDDEVTEEEMYQEIWENTLDYYIQNPEPETYQISDEELNDEMNK